MQDLVHMEGSPYPYSALFRALVDDGKYSYDFIIYWSSSPTFT